MSELQETIVVQSKDKSTLKAPVHRMSAKTERTQSAAAIEEEQEEDTEEHSLDVPNNTKVELSASKEDADSLQDANSQTNGDCSTDNVETMSASAHSDTHRTNPHPSARALFGPITPPPHPAPPPPIAEPSSSELLIAPPPPPPQQQQTVYSSGAEANGKVDNTTSCKGGGIALMQQYYKNKDEENEQMKAIDAMLDMADEESAIDPQKENKRKKRSGKRVVEEEDEKSVSSGPDETVREHEEIGAERMGSATGNGGLFDESIEFEHEDRELSSTQLSMRNDEWMICPKSQSTPKTQEESPNQSASIIPKTLRQPSSQSRQQQTSRFPVRSGQKNAGNNSFDFNPNDEDDDFETLRNNQIAREHQYRTPRRPGPVKDAAPRRSGPPVSNQSSSVNNPRSSVNNPRSSVNNPRRRNQPEHTEAPRRKRRGPPKRNTTGNGETPSSQSVTRETRKRQSEELVQAMIKARDFTKFNRGKNTIMTAISRVPPSDKPTEYQATVDRISNATIDDAETKLHRLLNEPVITIGPGKKKASDVHDERRKSAQSLVDSSIKGIQLIGVSTIQVHINNITWDPDVVIDDDLVARLKVELLMGTRQVVDLTLRGYWRNNAEDNGRTFFIHRNPEYVLTYRWLAQQTAREHPDFYIPIGEEDVHINNPSSSSSTQPETSSHRLVHPSGSTSMSQQLEPTGRKEENPFAYMFAIMTNTNGLQMDMHLVSAFKSAQLAVPNKQDNAWKKMKYYWDAAHCIKMDLVHLNYTDIKANLKKLLQGFVNQTLSRTLKLGEEMFNMLLQTMQEHDAEIVNTESFVQAYLKARSVCTSTADKALYKVYNKEMSGEDAKNVFDQHELQVKYFMRGCKLSIADSMRVQDTIEPGENTLKRLRFLINKGKKLSRDRLLKVSNQAEGVLEASRHNILERELNPCLAFQATEVHSRPVNDGKDGERHKCIVGLTTLQDLRDRPQVFTDAVAAGRHTLLIVTDPDDSTSGDSAAATDIFKNVYKDIGGWRLFFQACQHEGDDNVSTSYIVPATLIAYKDGVVFDRSHLRNYFKDFFNLSNEITNFMLRQMIFDVNKCNAKVNHRNAYNAIFVHSNHPFIIGILANMAPRRVYTSLVDEELELFEVQLNSEVAHKANGTTFTAQIKGPDNTDADTSQIGDNDSIDP